MALHSFWIYVQPGNPVKSYEVVEELTVMITHIQFPTLIMSFDQDITLLVEKGRVNMIQGGVGARIAFFNIEKPDESVVVDQDGKRYTVTYSTWTKDITAEQVGFFFEVSSEPIEPAADPEIVA